MVVLMTDRTILFQFLEVSQTLFRSLPTQVQPVAWQTMAQSGAGEQMTVDSLGMEPRQLETIPFKFRQLQMG